MEQIHPLAFAGALVALLLLFKALNQTYHIGLQMVIFYVQFLLCTKIHDGSLWTALYPYVQRAPAVIQEFYSKFMTVTPPSS